MACSPLIHGACTPNLKLKNGADQHSPSSSSHFCSSSFDHRLGFSPNLCILSGLNSFCKSSSLRIQAMANTQGNITICDGARKSKSEPDHLLVLVHGILASPSDWTYVQAELKKRLGSNFLIYASSSNTYTKTFSGIDGAGKRLADEVKQVVRERESLKRISFLAHSLGGLFARYAIAVLHSYQSLSSSQPNELPVSRNRTPEVSASSFGRGTIAGLEPISFITLASPHLGGRGKRQLPFLLGVPILEKIVPSIAPILVGRTGRQLFLTDGEPSKPPLLLRMTSDCEEGQFISALAAFRSRVLYANVSYDQHRYGWLAHIFNSKGERTRKGGHEITGTLGGQNDGCRVLPPRRSLDGYKHVVDVEYCPPVSSDGPHFPPEAAKAKEEAQNSPSPQNTLEYHEIMEEEMISGLQRVGWKKVDVSFHSAFWPFFAHNNIHVKNEWIHNAGAGVIAHVADSLKQQESSTFLAASL
ncbi:hypothetical protein Sjap_026084 [Stephania japonica]|uniref:DUF676 domain-containing protein n=1 Tax=Stephania japonica TaxID=461633 RepID=A0AAP0EAQ4_9MAGN